MNIRLETSAVELGWVDGIETRQSRERGVESRETNSDGQTFRTTTLLVPPPGKLYG